jgi:hypothetical protein
MATHIGSAPSRDNNNITPSTTEGDSNFEKAEMPGRGSVSVGGNTPAPIAESARDKVLRQFNTERKRLLELPFKEKEAAPLREFVLGPIDALPSGSSVSECTEELLNALVILIEDRSACSRVAREKIFTGFNHHTFKDRLRNASIAFRAGEQIDSTILQTILTNALPKALDSEHHPMLAVGRPETVLMVRPSRSTGSASAPKVGTSEESAPSSWSFRAFLSRLRDFLGR